MPVVPRRRYEQQLKGRLEAVEKQAEIYRQETHRWKEADAKSTARIETLELALRDVLSAALGFNQPYANDKIKRIARAALKPKN